MEFVEINADRKPKLTGGRRGNATLLPGGTQVNSNLVPISQLPASAGALGNTFKDIYNERLANQAYQSGKNPVRAIYMLPDNPVISGGKKCGKKGGKMSKLVPEHGHGASTQIGTNYKLSQFGGSMAEPIGNTEPTLSPALSGMSVGAGRKKKSKKEGGRFNLLGTIQKIGHAIGKPFELVGVNPWDIGYDLGHDVIGPALKKSLKMGKGIEMEEDTKSSPKGKDLKNLIRYMAETKAKLHGMKTGGRSFFNSAFKVVKDIGKNLLEKHGEQILNKGKDLLLKEIEKKASDFIGAGVLEGGAFFDHVLSGLKSVLNNKVVQQLGKEILHKTIDVVGNVAKEKLLGAGVGAAKKPSARGAIVSRIMKEKNLSLPLASKYVKEHGLY